MPIPKKNQLIGLDIGSHSIKVVEINSSKKGMILKNFGVIGLPEESVSEGTIKEMEIVSAAIKTLFKNLKIKNKNIATSISGYSVIVKKISIDKRDEAELEKTIQDEAEQYIPFDINDVNLDYEILNLREAEASGRGGDEDEDGSSGLMDVMLVAAKKDIVDDYVGLLHLTGLNPGTLPQRLTGVFNPRETHVIRLNNHETWTTAETRINFRFQPWFDSRNGNLH